MKSHDNTAGIKVSVSVIIPTYKHQDVVRETLDSVFAQTFTDYEVIVVNDGSPDDTREVLLPLAESGKIRYIEQQNQGQAAARNRGIAEARGEFIALLDDDDLWPPDKLQWQVEAMRAAPESVLVYGFFRTFGQVEGEQQPESENGALRGDVSVAFRRRNHIGSPGQCLIKASALRAIDALDPDLWGVDDWDLYIRLAKEGKFLYEHRCALEYRVHTQNASKNILQMHRNALRLRRKHFGRIPKPSDLPQWIASGQWVRSHFGSHCRQNAAFLAQSGRFQEANRALLEIFWIDPLYFRHPHFIWWILRNAGLRKPSLSRHR